MLRYSEFFDISDRFSSHPAAFIRYTTRPVYPEYGFKSAARLSDSFQCIEIHPAYLDLIQGVEALRFNSRDSVNMYFRFADGSVIEIAVLQEMDLWTDGQRILGSIK